MLGMAGLAMTSCASPVYVQANLQGYGLDPAELASFRAFVLTPDPDSPNPLRDQAVAQLLAAELTARGLQFRGAAAAAAAPDEFAVLLRLTIDESSVDVPLQVEMHDAYWPYHSWHYPTSWQYPGSWHTQAWAGGGYTLRLFRHALELQFRDAAGRELWRGNLTTVGESGDLMAVLRACLPAFLAEFPAPSGAPADRRFEVDAIVE